MSDFQAQFDAHVAAANSALLNRTTALQDAHFGMHPNHVRRLLESISRLLGKVDTNSLDHPEFLALSSSTIPERAVELIQQIPSSVSDGGVDAFVKNVLPQLVATEQALEKAVGVGAYKIKEIKQTQIRRLNQIIDWASQRNIEANQSKRRLEELEEQNRSLKDQLASIVTEAGADGGKVRDIRAQAETLSSGNASKNPLEKLVRAARERDEEMEALRLNAKKVVEEAANASKAASSHAESAKSSLSQLDATDEKARGILSTATQAGLAGAYKMEREKLADQQKNFAWIFYGVIVGVIIYAAVFILPIVKEILAKSGDNIFTEDNALMLLVRSLVLLPAIWALIFTNRRFVYLETLQMDYAAKTTTALAYFGYREEMDEDPSLSKRLKDGLVARFLEHPSRLLGKKLEHDKSEIGPTGVTVTSETQSPAAQFAGVVTDASP